MNRSWQNVPSSEIHLDWLGSAITVALAGATEGPLPQGDVDTGWVCRWAGGEIEVCVTVTEDDGAWLPRVTVCAVAATGLPVVEEVLIEVNEVAMRLSNGRAFLVAGSLMIEVLIPLSRIDVTTFAEAISDVAVAAARSGPLLSVMYGGESDFDASHPDMAQLADLEPGGYGLAGPVRIDGGLDLDGLGGLDGFDGFDDPWDDEGAA